MCPEKMRALAAREPPSGGAALLSARDHSPRDAEYHAGAGTQLVLQATAGVHRLRVLQWVTKQSHHPISQSLARPRTLGVAERRAHWWHSLCGGKYGSALGADHHCQRLR